MIYRRLMPSHSCIKAPNVWGKNQTGWEESQLPSPFYERWSSAVLPAALYFLADGETHLGHILSLFSRRKLFSHLALKLMGPVCYHRESTKQHKERAWNVLWRAPASFIWPLLIKSQQHHFKRKFNRDSSVVRQANERYYFLLRGRGVFKFERKL